MKTTAPPRSPRPFRPLSRVAAAHAALLIVVVLALASAGAAASDCSPFSTQSELVLVREVVDGDSLVLEDGTKVRIIGINSTEIWGDPHPAPYSHRARRHAHRLIRSSGRRVRLYPGAEKHDRYGRTLAHVVLEDGSDLSEVLLLAGMAAAIYVPPNTDRANCYHRAERLARRHHRGLWSVKNAFHRRFQVVEGKVGHFQRGHGSMVVHVGARQLPVVILTNNWQPDSEVFTLSKLHGRKVRASGWLNRRGHMIVRHPLAFEFLDEEQP